MKINVPKEVQEIISVLQEHGHDAYAVGGCVRDSLLGRAPADWDITTSAKPMEVKRLFRRTVDTGIQHGTVTVMFGKEGFEVTVLNVDKNGVVDLEQLKSAIKDETILISVMHANNETGVIQPIEEIGKIAKENKILFHVDAVQSMGKLEINPKEMGIDLLVFTAHKFYGPKGVGALYVRNGVRLGKVITGGGQERKLRPGTTNTPLIVGMAKALEKAYAEREEENKRVGELRDYFEEQISARIPEIVINGKDVPRLPGTSSITFKYVEGESILLSLSMKGIAVSSGSACSSDELQASHVLLAMGIPAEFAHGTIRFSLGKYNTKEEIDYTIEAVVEIIGKLRMMSPLWNEFNR